MHVQQLLTCYSQFKFMITNNTQLKHWIYTYIYIYWHYASCWLTVTALQYKANLNTPLPWKATTLIKHCSCPYKPGTTRAFNFRNRHQDNNWFSSRLGFHDPSDIVHWTIPFKWFFNRYRPIEIFIATTTRIDSKLVTIQRHFSKRDLIHDFPDNDFTKILGRHPSLIVMTFMCKTIFPIVEQ